MKLIFKGNNKLQSANILIKNISKGLLYDMYNFVYKVEHTILSEFFLVEIIYHYYSLGDNIIILKLLYFHKNLLLFFKKKKQRSQLFEGLFK